MRSRKTRVFISYSHDNAAERLALEGELTKAGFEVRYDTGIGPGAQVHREISRTINWADIVVPILTTDWLASHECRDELVRAHERRKTIVPFRRESLTNDGPPRIPFFLHEIAHIDWGSRDIQDACKRLVAHLTNADELSQWKADCYHNIRLAGDYIQQSDNAPSWQGSLARRVLEITENNLKGILIKGDCEFDVAPEHSYLRFAEPIFGNADLIIAICIASISTFWTNPDFHQESTRYLSVQRSSAKSVNRLFVFESPIEANSFKNVLQSHHDKYGKNSESSGVYLCSKEQYILLLKRWELGADERRLREDFGILKFPDSPRRMRAVLNERQFRFRCYDPEDVEDPNRIREFHNDKVEGDFVRLRAVPLGERDGLLGVVRWDPTWLDDSERFASALELMFPRYPGQSVHHFVRLTPSDSAADGLGDYLHGMVARFSGERAELKIDDISVLARCDAPAIDGRFLGLLGVDADYAFMLHFRFADETALDHYYRHQLHSRERELLYRRLNPDIHEAFDALNHIPLREYEERRKAFDSIERRMRRGGHVRRCDFKDGSSLTQVSRMRGIPFGEHRR